MRLFRQLTQAEDGGAMVETALALPVLLAMIWGITQFGLAVHANNGIQNALGEGARFATLCVQPTIATGCRRPTNQQIIDRINERRFSSTYGTFGTPTVTAGPSTEPIPYIVLAVSYSMPTNLIFVNGPVITFNRSKRVYVTGEPVPAT
jgi:Flp pilus assembly protein TadG